jgi:hypothetical protein
MFRHSPPETKPYMNDHQGSKRTRLPIASSNLMSGRSGIFLRTIQHVVSVEHPN